MSAGVGPWRPEPHPVMGVRASGPGRSLAAATALLLCLGGASARAETVETELPIAYQAGYSDGPSCVGGICADVVAAGHLPVAISGGEPTRHSAVAFDLYALGPNPTIDRFIAGFTISPPDVDHLREHILRRGLPPAGRGVERAQIDACPILDWWYPPGGSAPYDCTEATHGVIDLANGRVEFDLTSIAQSWAARPISNRGIALVGRVDPEVRGWQVELHGAAGSVVTVEEAGRASVTYTPGVEDEPPIDRTGITDTTITIGMHGPTSGAAPMDAEALEAGVDLYWRWLEATGSDVLGRSVRAVFENDNYNPVQAVAVCKKMAETDEAFLLVGINGTDQVRACGSDYASPRWIPYLSPGVQEVGLADARSAFALTMTFRQQVPLLMKVLGDLDAQQSLDVTGSVLGGPDGIVKVALVRPNTPNFDDAGDAFRDAAAAAGWTYRAFNVPKDADAGTHAGGTASNLENGGYDVAIPITSARYTAGLIRAADASDYAPRWATIGTVGNTNRLVADVCEPTSGIQGAVALSPWPGMAELTDPAGPLDPDFLDAVTTLEPEHKNPVALDLLYELWGMSRATHLILEHAGEAGLDRVSVVRSMASLEMQTGLFPSWHHDGAPFGARDAHVLEADCTAPGHANLEGGPQWISHPLYPGLRSP